MKTAKRSLLLSLAVAISFAASALGVEQARLVQIDRFLQQHLDENPVPGFSAVVVVGDEIVFEKGYGVVILGESAEVTSRSPIT